MRLSAANFYKSERVVRHPLLVFFFVPGADTIGAISHNEIGWRGEHPAAPDGCAIDYEGESNGVNVTDNFIHDSVRRQRTH